jgi:hypothetical protein
MELGPLENFKSGPKIFPNVLTFFLVKKSQIQDFEMSGL